jgi:hypothetical protein
MVDNINSMEMGSDFNITYGKAYAIITNRNSRVSIPGSELLDPVSVTLNKGLNLVAVHGYKTEYTAQSLVDSMNKVEGVSVESITSWDTSKGRYETFQIKEGQIFGFDFKIIPEQGYFIKLNTTNDEDTLTWNGN